MIAWKSDALPEYCLFGPERTTSSQIVKVISTSIPVRYVKLLRTMAKLWVCLG